MAKKPVEIFKSDQEFQIMAKDYQHKLFLDNWFIIFKLVDSPIYQDDLQLWGCCSYSFENSSAVITVYNGKDSIDAEYQSKNIAELTLLHELLHLKLEYMTDAENVGNMSPLAISLTHQGLETMAKTIIMFKYNVPYDYFAGTAAIPNNLLTRSNANVKK